VRIVGATGSVVLNGKELRRVLGQSDIKSTLFSVRPAPEGGFVFEGKGAGHGVGLCQRGADGMASLPYNHNYEEILAHYYPGTILEPATAAASPPSEKQPQTALNPGS